MGRTVTRVGRRKFINHSALTAILAPVVCHSLLASAQTPEAAKVELPRLKLTAKQNEDVNKALERRNQQLAPMRGCALPYDLEPAFVFAAWTRPRSERKPGSAR